MKSQIVNINDFSYLLVLTIFTMICISYQVSFGQEIIPSHLNETAQVSGTNMTVKYDLTGGSLVSINADRASDSLVVSLHVSSGGTFIINLPRALIDAKQNGDDTHFLVQVNEHGVNYEEIASPSNRILKISFNQGTEKIRIVGTQMLVPPSTLTQSPSAKPETLEAPFTDTPPAINGEWNTPLEWDKLKAVNSEINGTDMYVLAKHDSKFLYILVDIPTDNTTSSSASFLRYDLLMIFNRGMYEGDNLGSNETAVGTSHVFLNGTKISTNLGSEIWTYDNDGKPLDLQTPSDYNSTMGFSSTNDPFNSAQDHRLYEFRIPLSLLNESDKYGFSVGASACVSHIVSSTCSTIYSIFWPPRTIITVPSSYGVLELTGKAAVPEFPLAEVVLVLSIASVISFYRMKFR